MILKNIVEDMLAVFVDFLHERTIFCIIAGILIIMWVLFRRKVINWIRDNIV